MGARVIKTGLAVTIASAICQYLQIPVIFAALSAVINIKPSVVQSWNNAFEQVYVHLLGVTMAFAIGYTIGANPLTIGLATVTVIWLCNRFGWSGGTVMGVLAAIFILTAPSEKFEAQALLRTQAVFVGLGVALLVNYFILPPRYGQNLRRTLRELAEFNLRLFNMMVQAFVELQPISAEEFNANREKIQRLLDEAGDLMKRYREQVGKVKPRGTKPSNNPVFLEDYLRYQQGIYERTIDLEGVIEQRLKRRLEAGDQPLSEEFKQVLNQVTQGVDVVVTLNQQLAQVVFEHERVEPIPIPDGYWDDLAAIMEQWHGKYSGVYYLHALVEVGFVIGEVRWAAQQARQLFLKAGVN